MCPKSRTKWHFSCERIPKFVWLRTWRSRTLLCSEHVQREGQRSVTRPDRAGRKSTVTQNATLYDRVEQKSISERTACQKTTTGGNNIASLDSNVKPVVNTAEISLTSNVFLNTALLLWGTITCPSPWKQFRNYPLQEQVRKCTFFFFVLISILFRHQYQECMIRLRGVRKRQTTEQIKNFKKRMECKTRCSEIWSFLQSKSVSYFFFFFLLIY